MPQLLGAAHHRAVVRVSVPHLLQQAPGAKQLLLRPSLPLRLHSPPLQLHTLGGAALLPAPLVLWCEGVQGVEIRQAWPRQLLPALLSWRQWRRVPTLCVRTCS
jgi:hypothetical protein